MVGVSDTPFPDSVEGFIGTDVFAPYLITLNFPEAKLEVEPLPRLPGEQKSALPGDRYVAPDVRGYAPVYRKGQYLLVPIMLNKKDRRLFVLDTGIRLTTMTSEVASLRLQHSRELHQPGADRLRRNPTNLSR